MALLEKQLLIKTSKIPGAGKGLFTKCFIAKGTFIIQYKGKITTWKEVQQSKNFNGYVFYINRNRVIDAKPFTKHLARYANDASGISKIKGLRNNSNYVHEKDKVFIKAIKDIQPGEEILVSYGKDYWDVIKYNKKLSDSEARLKKKQKIINPD